VAACSLILTGAPLTARGPQIAQALIENGWQVQVAATPAALPWIDAAALTDITGASPRVDYRDPDQPRGSDRPDVVVVAPATFNTINKLAAGIADTYAHSTACTAIGAGAQIVIVPMVNNLLWGHPALAANLRFLANAGVTMIDIATGALGVDALAAVQSGTGGDVVAAFDVEWIISALRQPAQKS
jgi:phosphopantothenoylcysteine synthetase/decarboxylase